MKSSTPDRLACVDLPAFPLQLLLKRRPQWADRPVAVVAEDKPQGKILWINDRARQLGVLPGMRYAAGFSLAPGLRASEVTAEDIDRAVVELADRLMRWTPDVEPAKREPGVFWLNGAGLKHLFAFASRWGRAIEKDIQGLGYRAAIVIGFSRFGTYAIAKSTSDIIAFRDAEEEQTAAKRVTLDRLGIEPKLRDVLAKLGIATVGELLKLPPGGLRERFGAEAHRLYRMAAGDLWTPLDPKAPEAPVEQRRILDDPEDDAERLLFLIKQMLHPMLATLATRAQAMTVLQLSLLIDHGGWLKESLRPAEPTLNAVQILDLVRLRLESLQLPAGIIEIELHAESCAATREQLRLFVERPIRDLDAANRALARLRAEFGDDAVVHAKLKDGHLPEASFEWEPLDHLEPPKTQSNRPDGSNGVNVSDNVNGSNLRNRNPSTDLRAGSSDGLNLRNGLNDLNGLNGAERLNGPPILVRRIHAKPIKLSGSPNRTHEDGWLLLGPKYGSVEKLTGPYIFSGGWWNREIQREYYYAETRRGDLLWVYYDRVRRRWFLQGAIE